MAHVRVKVFVATPTLNLTFVPSYHICPSMGDVGAVPAPIERLAYAVVPIAKVSCPLDS